MSLANDGTGRWRWRRGREAVQGPGTATSSDSTTHRFRKLVNRIRANGERISELLPKIAISSRQPCWPPRCGRLALELAGTGKAGRSN